MLRAVTVREREHHADVVARGHEAGHLPGHVQPDRQRLAVVGDREQAPALDLVGPDPARLEELLTLHDVDRGEPALELAHVPEAAGDRILLRHLFLLDLAAVLGVLPAGSGLDGLLGHEDDHWPLVGDGAAVGPVDVDD